MKLYVINLPDSAKRREALSDQLSRTSLDWEIFPAFDGRKMGADERSAIYDGKLARNNVGREMSNGEIGCAMSHRLVYRKMIDKNVPDAVVLEDDVVLDERFADAILSLSCFRLRNTVVKLEKDFEGLRCSLWGGVSLEGGWKIKKPVERKYFLAAGYYLDNAAARSLLGYSEKIVNVSDHWDFYRRFVDVRVLVPGIVRQDRAVSSDIWEYETVSSLSATKKRYPRGVNFFVRNARNLDFSFFRQFLP